MKVLVGGDKGDTTVFLTPIAAVRWRIDQMYVHCDEPGLVELAREIVAEGNHERAWRFLRGREQNEYEGIEAYEVIE